MDIYSYYNISRYEFNTLRGNVGVGNLGFSDMIGFRVLREKENFDLL